MHKKNKILLVGKVFAITLKYLMQSKNKKSEISLLKKLWASDIISLFNINLSIEGQVLNSDQAIIFVGNHISYLDIPILLAVNDKISFVGKEEIKSWPIVGKAAQEGQTIFVNREDRNSRENVKNKVTDELLKNKLNLAIFPSGTTSLHTSSRWRRGIFDIAEKNEVKVQPFRIKYNPLAYAAYVGDDNLIQHMYHLFNLNELNVSIEFHEPVMISNSSSDCERWKNWCES